MSSNRPPQIHLSLHAENGTSFKRSFEQYGFDLDAPLTDASEAGGSGLSGVGSADRNDRNKRARSESSLSNTDELAESSGSSDVGPAGSSGATSIEDDSMSGLSATRPNSLADNVLRISPPVLTELSRLPSPDFEDVEMSAIGDSGPLSPHPIHSTSVSGHEEGYRASLERFSVFDNAISALRQSTSRPPASSPTLPPLSTVAEDNEAHAREPAVHPRVPSHAFRNLEFVEEDSNIPGLQVFTLGELHSSESDGDSGEGTMQRDLDERLDENLTLRSQNSSREPPGRFSTLVPHAPPTAETSNVTREQMPTLPRLSPAPFFSQQDFEWWPSELSSSDPSTRSPSRPRPDASSRGATDYMPPRDWIGVPSSSRVRQTGTLNTSANASWSRRRVISRARPQHMELVDDVSDDDQPVFFPSVAQLPSDRYEQERPVLERHRDSVDVQRPSGASSRLSGERHPRQSEFDADLRLHFSHNDRLPSGRAEAFARSRVSLMQRPHERLEDVRSRFGRRLTLPGIEISDVESDVRPRLLDRIHSRPSPPRSSNSTGSLASLNHPQRSAATISAFLRRPIASDHGPSSSTNASRLSPSTSNVDDAESGMDWSMPLYPIDPSRQPPPAAQERFQSHLYSSRVASSNSLVSENAAELRRNLARSQMLQTLPQDDDTSNLLSADSPWRTRHEPETDPWSQPINRAAMLRDAPNRPRPRAGEPWRDRTSNPSLRPYASSLSTSRTVGRTVEGDHRFNPLLGPPSTSPFVRSTAPVSSANNLTSRINRDRTLPGMVDPSQTVALSTTSPTSPVFGLSSNSQQISQRTRVFPSTVDASRGISTARPVRAQSPVAWDDFFESAAHPSPEADSPVPGHTDHDMRIPVRQRPSLVDVGPFRSPSPASPAGRAPRSPESPRATPVSTYRNLDLSAYHEGPFRASLQRYVDFDRIRSRLSRLESMADNVSSRPTLAPSLPPLQFENDDHVSAANASSRATPSARLLHCLQPTTRISIFLIWCAKPDWAEAHFRLRPPFRLPKIIALIFVETEAPWKPTFEPKEIAGLRGQFIWTLVSIILLLSTHGKTRIGSNRNDSVHMTHGYSLSGVTWCLTAQWTPRPILVQSLLSSLALLTATMTFKAVDPLEKEQTTA
ncbi:hypothetical protein PILCRDRAFT_309403 [Piloderma croceum F 1598]|uniref:Uncharacterized protein n=1 Tax=Piloderma croceum (strain F 1598) TaxID=765440 RepID=A0A0C3FRS1_PILCF|nr:hypothetical protein PILCRDRAFT_309403 [Piloderma croceum F 1598]